MPERLRIHFQEELAALEAQALGGLDLVAEQLERTMDALERRDAQLASVVVADDDRIDGRYLEVHQGVLSLLARQAPVAGDLRVVAALLHVIKHVERMGDQCVNVAKLIPLAGGDAPVDAELVALVERMGALAEAQLQQAKRAFATRDAVLAEDLVRADDELDALNRQCFQRAVACGTDEDRREWAMHMMLMARAIERLGDNAVDIGEQVAFIVSGLFREFSDASHP